MLKLMQQSEQRQTLGEQGIVAILTVLIVMGILTLLTLGFSNITRQAQKRTLDDQLSTQAFYAAETGINRAWEMLDAGTITADKTDCRGGTGFGYDVDPDLGISINCLLVDTSPSSVQIDSVPLGQGRVFYMGRLAADPAINQLTFHWDSADARGIDGVDFGPDGVFNNNMPRLYRSSEWGRRVGMLRIDLIPITNNLATTLERGNLVANSYSFILYPGGNSGTDGKLVQHTIGTSNADKGIVLGRYCSSVDDPEYRCTATVNLGGLTSTRYFVRLQSYYNPTSVEIEARDVNGNEVEFRDTQAVVDSTGRVQDVSRRLQVRVPILTELNRFPGYHESFSILSASSLCKRIIGVPGASTVDTSGTDGDPVCRISD